MNEYNGGNLPAVTRNEKQNQAVDKMRRARFIDGFEAVLLDMGNTFMFNVDRFSETDDFGATYRRLGGGSLGDGEVGRIILSVFRKMLSECRDPVHYECFPSVSSYLESSPETKALSKTERVLLEQVFAAHEIGVVPESHADAIRRLRETHRLGVVSDIWSASDLYRKEFDRVGIWNLFDVILFSSDHGVLKPSPKPFLKAIDALGLPPSRILFVGDSLRRDIAGAKAEGLSTAWIDGGTGNVDGAADSPDLVIQDLRDLLS